MVNTGNQDLCYYNFLCSLPVASVRDFNHIFSNIAYMFFGVLFMGIVGLKKLFSRRHDRTQTPSDKEARPGDENPTSFPLVGTTGLPTHYGVYIAMGMALVLEGVLSACYHVCPTNINFQFDTTFMYVISLLCLIKLYQKRHADVTSSAYKVSKSYFPCE